MNIKLFQNSAIMELIKTDTSLSKKYISDVIYEQLKSKLPSCHRMLLEKSGAGNEFTGWLHIDNFMPESLLEAIEQSAQSLRKISQAIVVIGIGGSYLGARAVIEALSNPFSFDKKDYTQILFAGFNLSDDYHAGLLEYLNNVDYSVIVISKSGTTTEPAVAFRLLFSHLLEKYGEKQIKNRVICITDEKKGALRKIASQYGFSSFIIPDDIGGRYSVLTPVGLLPIAAAGFNIRNLIEGAKRMMKEYYDHHHLPEMLINDYILTRMSLEKKGYLIELFVTYQPQMFYFMEWLKQLFGESEGKEGKGLFPASVIFTTDLHSLGQYIQEGKRLMFETVLNIVRPAKSVEIPSFTNNDDDLNYLAGKTLGFVNAKAMKGTQMAHIEGDVPNIEVIIPSLNEYYLGQMIYFFETACAISGYLNDINPFDQPGVEAYKKNMFTLLGKPGF